MSESTPATLLDVKVILKNRAEIDPGTASRTGISPSESRHEKKQYCEHDEEEITTLY